MYRLKMMESWSVEPTAIEARLVLWDEKAIRLLFVERGVAAICRSREKEVEKELWMRWGGIWCNGVGAKDVKPLQDKSWATV